MRLDTWTIYGNAFHFGRHGIGQEETNVTFSSDSLFAALVARLAHNRGAQAAEDFGNRFRGANPPFVLSSTFPLAGSVRFFPTPARAKSKESAGVDAKTLKKTAFISERLFRQVLDGAPLAELYPSAVKLHGGALLVDPADAPGLPEAQRGDPSAPLWKVEQRPRVTLARVSSLAGIFFTGRLAFAAHCGLWFGARFSADVQMKPLLDDLLQDLAEAGLGAERSVGFGACSIQPGGALDLPAKGAGSWVTLSAYLPKDDETSALADPAAAYQLRTVGGWVDSAARSGQRRRPIRLLTEGSVFGPLAGDTPGQVADVRPIYQNGADPLGHPVYRCGLALAVGYSGGAQ